MSWVPFVSFSIRTDLPLEAIVDRATSQIEPARLFANPFRKDRKPFVGTVGRHGFKVAPLHKWYEHQTINVAEGRFVQTPSGVRVDVRFRVQWIMAALIVFFLGIFAIGGLASARGMLEDVGAFLGPGFLAAFLYGSTLLRFNKEEGSARATIQAWFGDHVRNEAGIYRPPPMG